MRKGAIILATLAFVAVSGLLARRCTKAKPHQKLVAQELADETALAQLADWQGLPVFRLGTYLQQSSEDRLRAEHVAIPLWENGNRDMNNFLCASADAEPQPDGSPLSVDLPKCPEPYVRGYVLARFEGSGRLARMWLTAASLRRAPADHEVLRLYVDDSRSPVIELPLSQVLDGSGAEVFSWPFGALSSRRLAWYYPVVFSSKLIVSLDHLDPKDLYFHQTAVVLDDKPQNRKRAPQRLTMRDQVIALLRSEVPTPGALQVKQVSLPAGEAVTAADLEGPATLVDFRLRVKPSQVYELERVQLRVHWDNAKEASLDLPLSYLFGAVQALPPEASLALGAGWHGRQVELRLRLPMPFARRAEWVMSNRTEQPIELQLAFELTPGVPDKPWGRLRVQHYETNRTDQRTHPLAVAAGQGRLVGVCMFMRGHGLPHQGMVMNFLEGDEIGIVDGRKTIAGTGTEDYFNGAFYFEDGANATPFAQIWGLAVNPPDAPGQARVSACRWHVLGDAIDFSSSLRLDMEIGPGVPQVLDRYRSVAYLYQ